MSGSPLRSNVGKVERVEDYQALCHFAAEHWVRVTAAAVEQRGLALVALSGGSTPKALYQLLAGDAFRPRVPWDKIHFFWGDERSVPPDHADSNYRMVREAMLNTVGVAAESLHRMPADAADLDDAARRYEAEVRRFGGSEGAMPQFDLIHLGMGDDGHTASLFPHTAALTERVRLVVPNHVEKLNTNRMTFTYTLINNAREVLFLVSGSGKANILQQVLQGPLQEETLPSQGIRPTNGVLTWLLDEAAAAAL